jgi:hypothetical protein
MHLVLILPGLLAQSREHASASDAPCPCLARLIAEAASPLREAEGLDALVASHYGIARQNDWPLAALRLAALGADPGGAYWIMADPVTLVAGREDVRPAGAVLNLTPGEAERLIDTLNRHFAADGLAFVAPCADAWFVRVSSPPRVTTHALDAAAGRALKALLPEGPDAPMWRRWLSEIQMLLHDHPVNVERERRGQAPVSSVWFSGGGTLPARSSGSGGTRTWASGGIVAALAQHTGVPAQVLPADLAMILCARDDTGHHVVALDAPLDLAAIEAAWTVPAWRALTHGKLRTVVIMGDGGGEALAWTARRPGFWQRMSARFSKPDLHALLEAARATP